MKKFETKKLNLGKVKISNLSHQQGEAVRPTYTGCSLKCPPPTR